MTETDEYKIVKPEFMVCRIDETAAWKHDWPDELKDVDKVWGIYIYDKSRRTFLCELTPSYCLECISSDFDSTKEMNEYECDAIYTVIEHNMEGVYYHHCPQIDSLPCENNVKIESLRDIEESEYADEESYNELFEEMHDAERANPTF